MRNDLQQSLYHLFSVEPGATALRAAERVNGPTSEAEIQIACAEMVADGQLKVEGNGWVAVPPPDPVGIARDALTEIETMPGPAGARAKAALDKIGRRP
jgi:hypothetical protein